MNMPSQAPAPPSRETAPRPTPSRREENDGGQGQRIVPDQEARSGQATASGRQHALSTQGLPRQPDEGARPSGHGHRVPAPPPGAAGDNEPQRRRPRQTPVNRDPGPAPDPKTSYCDPEARAALMEAFTEKFQRAYNNRYQEVLRRMEERRILERHMDLAQAARTTRGARAQPLAPNGAASEQQLRQQQQQEAERARRPDPEGMRRGPDAVAAPAPAPGQRRRLAGAAGSTAPATLTQPLRQNPASGVRPGDVARAETAQVRPVSQHRRETQRSLGDAMEEAAEEVQAKRTERDVGKRRRGATPEGVDEEERAPERGAEVADTADGGDAVDEGGGERPRKRRRQVVSPETAAGKDATTGHRDTERMPAAHRPREPPTQQPQTQQPQTQQQPLPPPQPQLRPQRRLQRQPQPQPQQQPQSQPRSQPEATLQQTPGRAFNAASGDSPTIYSSATSLGVTISDLEVTPATGGPMPQPGEPQAPPTSTAQRSPAAQTPTSGAVYQSPASSRSVDIMAMDEPVDTDMHMPADGEPSPPRAALTLNDPRIVPDGRAVAVWRQLGRRLRACQVSAAQGSDGAGNPEPPRRGVAKGPAAVDRMWPRPPPRAASLAEDRVPVARGRGSASSARVAGAAAAAAGDAHDTAHAVGGKGVSPLLPRGPPPPRPPPPPERDAARAAAPEPGTTAAVPEVQAPARATAAPEQVAAVDGPGPGPGRAAAAAASLSAMEAATAAAAVCTSEGGGATAPSTAASAGQHAARAPCPDPAPGVGASAGHQEACSNGLFGDPLSANPVAGGSFEEPMCGQRVMEFEDPIGTQLDIGAWPAPGPLAGTPDVPRGADAAGRGDEDPPEREDAATQRPDCQRRQPEGGAAAAAANDGADGAAAVEVVLESAAEDPARSSSSRSHDAEPPSPSAIGSGRDGPRPATAVSRESRGIQTSQSLLDQWVLSLRRAAGLSPRQSVAVQTSRGPATQARILEAHAKPLPEELEAEQPPQSQPSASLDPATDRPSGPDGCTPSDHDDPRVGTQTLELRLERDADEAADGGITGGASASLQLGRIDGDRSASPTRGAVSARGAAAVTEPAGAPELSEQVPVTGGSVASGVALEEPSGTDAAAPEGPFVGAAALAAAASARPRSAEPVQGTAQATATASEQQQHQKQQPTDAAARRAAAESLPRGRLLPRGAPLKAVRDWLGPSCAPMAAPGLPGEDLDVVRCAVGITSWPDVTAAVLRQLHRGDGDDDDAAQLYDGVQLYDDGAPQPYGDEEALADEDGMTGGTDSGDEAQQGRRGVEEEEEVCSEGPGWDGDEDEAAQKHQGAGHGQQDYWLPVHIPSRIHDVNELDGVLPMARDVLGAASPVSEGPGAPHAVPVAALQDTVPFVVAARIPDSAAVGAHQRDTGVEDATKRQPQPHQQPQQQPQQQQPCMDAAPMMGGVAAPGCPVAGDEGGAVQAVGNLHLAGGDAAQADSAGVQGAVSGAFAASAAERDGGPPAALTGQAQAVADVQAVPPPASQEWEFVLQSAPGFYTQPF